MISKSKRGRKARARAKMSAALERVAAAEKNRGGRPFLPAEDRHDKRLYVLTTEAELEELQGAAAHVGMPVSSWVRVVALERARALAAEIEAARERDE